MDGFSIMDRGSPVITAALHAGHELRSSLRPLCALDSAARLREEDPYTELIADVGTSMIVVRRSRFEVDLNRPREHAIYERPVDAWGLRIWSEPLPETERALSLAFYDDFYREAARLLDRTVSAHGGAVVFDVHSYNHRRGGPSADPGDPAGNPEVNLGTGTIDRRLWAGLLADTRACCSDAGFDVRENVRFRGGHFASWAHDRFEGSVAVLALEFKKTFMDEWTGEVDAPRLETLRSALAECARVAGSAIGGER